MGVLKVVSVWYGCWYECGLIIWGFIHLDNCFDICSISIVVFLLGYPKLWVLLD